VPAPMWRMCRTTSHARVRAGSRVGAASMAATVRHPPAFTAAAVLRGRNPSLADALLDMEVCSCFPLFFLWPEILTHLFLVIILMFENNNLFKKKLIKARLEIKMLNNLVGKCFRKWKCHLNHFFCFLKSIKKMLIQYGFFHCHKTLLM